MPDGQNLDVNTPLTFSADNNNAIKITDPNIDASDWAPQVSDSGFEAAGVTSGYQTGSTYGGWNYNVVNDSNYSGVVANGWITTPIPMPHPARKPR